MGFAIKAREERAFIALPILLLAESVTNRTFREEWLGPGGHPSQAAGRRIAPIPSLLGLA